VDFTQFDHDKDKETENSDLGSDLKWD